MFYEAQSQPWPCVSRRISSEHSPKLQIRSHSYLRAVSEVSINRSLDTLDPKTLLDPKSLLSSPQYRSRNESYMRAMSTISQVGRAAEQSMYTVFELSREMDSPVDFSDYRAIQAFVTAARDSHPLAAYVKALCLK